MDDKLSLKNTDEILDGQVAEVTVVPDTAEAFQADKVADGKDLSLWHRLLANKPLLLTLILATIVFLLAIAIAIYGLYYTDKAAPGTMVGEVKLGGCSQSQIENKIKKLFDSLDLTLRLGDGEIVCTPESLGLSVDSKSIAKQVVGFKNSSDFFSKLNFTSKKDVNLTLQIDAYKAATFLSESFPNQLTTPNEPSVHYDASLGQFVITAGETGTNLTDKETEDIVKRLASKPLSQTFELRADTIYPTVSDETANQTANKANDLIKKPYSFTIDGQIVYSLKQSVKASFLTFPLDLTTKAIRIEPNMTEINKAIVDRIGWTVNRPMYERIIVEKNGNLLYTIKQGADGRDLIDQGKLADLIATAIKGDQALTAPLNMRASAMTQRTIQMTPETRWIDVNITEKKVRLYIGDSIYREFLVSIGKPTTPTIQGAFLIERKYEKKDMTSGGDPLDEDYYLVKDVPWSSFFYRGYALHGAPWLTVAGTEISHGCINMMVGDAKQVYDFAPLGTLVVVHQ